MNVQLSWTLWECRKKRGKKRKKIRFPDKRFISIKAILYVCSHSSLLSPSIVLEVQHWHSRELHTPAFSIRSQKMVHATVVPIGNTHRHSYLLGVSLVEAERTRVPTAPSPSNWSPTLPNTATACRVLTHTHTHTLLITHLTPEPTSATCYYSYYYLLLLTWLFIVIIDNWLMYFFVEGANT